jgi:hypothetical protein
MSVGRFLLLASSLGFALATAQGSVIHVPASQPTIQAGVDAAASGDTVLVDGSGGPFAEKITISTSLVSSLTLMGEPGTPRPLILGVDEHAIMFKVENQANLPIDLTLQSIDFDGANVARYGVRAKSWDYAGDEVLVTLHLTDLTIQRCQYGVAIGSRTGAYGCEGRWGAVGWDLLGTSLSALYMDRCTIVESGDDGINLWRVTGWMMNSFVGYSGDEGMHTTDAQDMDFVHNVYLANHGIGVHFQLASNVVFENNVVARTLKGVLPGVVGTDGYGLVVGGSGPGEPLEVRNNLLVANDASGAKINPVEIIYAPDECEGVPTNVGVFNNLFRRNGLTSNDTTPDWDLYYTEHGIPGMRMSALYNLFPEVSKVANFTLDETNLIGLDPLFISEPTAADIPDSVLVPATIRGQVFNRVEGFALQPDSPAVDGGHPDPAFNDAGGLAQGTARNDIGAFGGAQSNWEQ